MGDRFDELMSRAQQHAIVGRRNELAFFSAEVLADPPRHPVMHVFGPGGVGKSTLLVLFAKATESRGLQAIGIDARNAEQTPPGIVAALCEAAGVADFESLDRLLLARPAVMFIDSYDELRPLDSWVRNHFLPLLPETTRLVMAGRSAPAVEWIASPALAGLHGSISLRNLDRNAAREVLRRRNVPDAQHAHILDFTHGHPLALSLVAEMYVEDPALDFRPERAPAIVHRLEETFIDRVSDPERRHAIELSAVVRTTNEELLSDVLEPDDPSALFFSLAAMSFMETRPRGVAPHDLARDAITVDLKWRNAGRYSDLHARARGHYRNRLDSRPSDHFETLMDYVYLHRESPFVRPYMDFSGDGEAHLDRLHPEDTDAILEMARHHEGDSGEAIARGWLEIDPTFFTVVRSMSGSIVGYLLEIPLDAITDEQCSFDELTERVRRGSATAFRPGERALLFRSWMASGTYQGISPVQSRIFIELVHRYLATPGLVRSYVTCADPEFWAPLFAYADMPRFEEFETPDHGVFGHDWRARPPVAWLDLLATRETAEQPALDAAPPTEELLVLSEADFRSAVADALRNLKRLSALGTSPLIRSALVVTRREGTPEETLAKLVRRAADNLRSDEHTAKFFPAIYHGFLNPAATHEAAARQAHLSYSTFRRYVAAARERIADELWRLETGAV